jgi:hypothetical protein
VGAVTDYIIIYLPTGCWLWCGTLNEKGYGHLGSEYVHRFAWAAVHGPIPSGMAIDHLCRVRCCCNPEHLEAVTPWENVLRTVNPFAEHARQSHCWRGHALSTIRRPGARERLRRVCKTCHADAERARRARVRASHAAG